MTTIADSAVTSVAAPTFGRRANLILRKDEKGLDLSKFRVRFATQQYDDETPNTAVIRVYNLAQETVNKVRGEFDQVVLQAGYEKGGFGTIFAGTITQFGDGQESNVDSYLDLLCADGDIGYNFGIVASTISKDMNVSDAIDAAAESMGMEVSPPLIDVDLAPGQDYIRGKVLFGMGRDVLRDAARSMDAAWSIQDGQVQFRKLAGYLPGEAVVLNSGSGLVGIPVLTNDGIEARCLLNARIRVGGLVQIDNKLINQVVQQSPDDLRRFNSFVAPSPLAKTNADGLYVVLVAEHEGDTRGPDWYTSLTCVAVQSDTGAVKAYG